MIAQKRHRFPPRTPADFDRDFKARNTQPMSKHQMALLMGVGELDAGPVVEVLLRVADTKKIDELNAAQCRKAASLLGIIDKFEHRLKQEK
jgi:hypothetical protein